MKDEFPSPYPVWPTMGFSEWYAAQLRRVCDECENGYHEHCEEGSKHWPECPCAEREHREQS